MVLAMWAICQAQTRQNAILLSAIKMTYIVTGRMNAQGAMRSL